MITRIIKEKTSADHLLYVSLKYTKTCDVILNLIERWKVLIEVSFDALLEIALKAKKIPNLPATPKEKIEFMKKAYKNNKIIQELIPIYIFFKRVPGLDKIREGEFRKNVNLKIKDGENTVEINMEKLKEYAEKLEKFISEVKQIISK